jgi:vacuolar-type H+-ATPase subunit E/Vma4
MQKHLAAEDREYDPEWGDRDRDYDYLSTRKRMAPPDKHITNKAEGKVLRHLMAETGLSEKQLREHKKYRKMLSDAQIEGTKAKRSHKQKELDKIMKGVTRELKLAKEHPDVQKLFKRRVKQANLSLNNSCFI